MNSKVLKYLSTVALLVLALPAWAQDAAAATDTKATFWQTHNTEILIGLFAGVMIIMLFVVFYLSSLLVSMTRDALLAQNPNAPISDVEFIPVSRFTNWAKLSKTLTNATPIEKEADIMLDHDYDGIKELDNHLPPWWVAMFYGTVVFALIYFPYYHFTGTDRSQIAEYEEAMKIATAEKEAYLAKVANLVNEGNVTALTDAGTLGHGKQIFIQYCAACHGQAGEGGVGPNLTDVFWLHGGGIKNVFSTIKYGVPDKGMIAWQDQITPKDMQDVASYILTLEGTNPANPKEPQGQPWSEEGTAPEAAPADSTGTATDSTGIQTATL